MHSQYKTLAAGVFFIAHFLHVGIAEAAAPPRERGALIGVQSLHRVDRKAIDGDNEDVALSGKAECDVRIVQLTYASIGVREEPATLSAALYVPENCRGPFPILAQAHGTQTSRRKLTTDLDVAGGSVTFFAAHGYLVVATDYLGLGKSDYPYHPYLHADSEASAVIDSIRAARQAARKLDVPISDQVMLFGYSQGGHAVMAAQREIEKKHGSEFNLVASAPMSGPYYLSQTFLGSWFGQTAGAENAFASELFSYAVVSYSKAYPDVCANLQDCIAPSYVEAAKTLFPGEQHLGDIREQNLLPPGKLISQMRNARFTAGFLLNEHDPFRQALIKNDLLDWAPVAPMLLCGSHRDAIVDFNNTYAAQAAFRRRGVEVTIVDVAESVPADAAGSEHHAYSVSPCYAAARERLFDPKRR